MILLLPQLGQAALDIDWLLGLSGGYIVQRARLTSTLNYTQAALVPGLFQTHFRNNIHDNSGMIGVLGGVQFNCNNWFLGLELALDGHSLDETYSFVNADVFGARGWNGQAQYDRGASFSGSLRWGYKVTKTIWPFIRLGVEASQDELTVTFSGASSYPGAYTTKDEKTMARFLAGFGAESIFPKVDPLKLRLEYNYLSRGKRLESQGLIIEGVADPYFMSETLARNHLWKFSVVWYFC